MLRKFLAALRARRHDRDLADEIAAHIAERTQDLIAQGLSESEASNKAHRELGSPLRTIEDSRRAWTFQWLEELLRDLGYAARSFRRSPGFVAAAVASLALGIGVNTSIFSLTMEFLFSQPSVAEPATLWSVRLGGSSHADTPIVNYLRDAKIFDAVTGYREESQANWRDGAETYRLHPLFVDRDFFPVIRPPLLMGRGIGADKHEAVLTHRFWQRRMSADPAILGRLMQINGEPFTIVGVLPPEHRTLVGFGFAPDLYLPHINPADPLAIQVRSTESRAVILEKLKAIGARLDKAFPREGMDPWGQWTSVRPVSGLEAINGGFKETALFFALLMIVVGLVLAIACANVSSLLLARASSRRQEMAVRAAIGAGRSRLVRQLLAESLLLTLLGTAAGLAINLALTRAAERLTLPLPVPIALRFDPDWRLFAYATGVAVLCAILAGLAPALRSTSAAALKADGRQTSDSGGRSVIGRWLVPVQIAISVVLLVTAALFLRNLGMTSTMDVGFDAKHVAWARMNIAPAKQLNGATRPLTEEAIARVRALPGVESAAYARIIPYNDASTSGRIVQAGGSSEKIHVEYMGNNITPGYFATMGIRILDGHDFTWADRKGTPAVAIINEAFALRVFGTIHAAGRQIIFPDTQPPDDAAVTIAAVCANSKHLTLGEDQKIALYRPVMQYGGPPREIHLLIRSANPGTILRPVRERLLDLDPTSAVEVRPMETAMAFAMLPSQAGAALLGTIGLLGLALAAVGLYGVLAFSVGRRTREIGVRIALGASPAQVSRLVLANTAKLAGIGLAIGLAISAFVTEPLAMFLVPNLNPRDPVTFAAVAVVLIIVALIAAAGPALRAMRVDPIQAIRYE